MSTHAPVWTLLKGRHGAVKFVEGITYDSHEELWARIAAMNGEIITYIHSWRYWTFCWVPMLMLVGAVVSLLAAFTLYGAELLRLEEAFANDVRLHGDFRYETDAAEKSEEESGSRSRASEAGDDRNVGDSPGHRDGGSGVGKGRESESGSDPVGPTAARQYSRAAT